MLGILVGAAILGLIITVMEQGEFPGWPKMIGCILAFAIPNIILTLALPPGLFFVGILVGAICATFAISYLVGMVIKRAAIAVGIFVGIQLAISAIIYFAFSR
jgi:hypothetical protein